MHTETIFEEFQSIRQAIKDELNWRSAGPTRDAVALALLPLAAENRLDYSTVRTTADALKANHSKLHFLKSSTRYAIAASLVATEMEPDAFTRQLATARETWKQLKLRRSSPYEGATLMTMLMGGRGVDYVALSELKTAFDKLNDDYFWHVGSFTLPALALALHHGVSGISRAAAIFEDLKSRKFPSSYRMSTALTASLDNDRSPAETTDWLVDAYHALKSRKMGSAARFTPALAMASLIEKSPEQFAEQADAYRGRFKEGVFSSSDAGMLAVNLTTMRAVIEMSDAPQTDELSGIMSIMGTLQAYIIIQQQAAVMAAVIGGAVAAGAAS